MGSGGRVGPWPAARIGVSRKGKIGLIGAWERPMAAEKYRVAGAGTRIGIRENRNKAGCWDPTGVSKTYVDFSE